MKLNEKIVKSIRAGLYTALVEKSEFAKFEDKKDELERTFKEVGKEDKKGRFTVKYRFGKNGGGLTKELVAIGDDIYKYSKKYFVTLNKETFFDPTDDVYDFSIYCQPLSLFEGAWGYLPNNSDTYWDQSHHLTKPLKKQFIDGLKSKWDDTKYAFMGFINGFIQNENIWRESIDKDFGYELYDLYKKVYDEMSAPDSKFASDWRDEQLFRDELEKVWQEFNVNIKKYIGVIIPKDLRDKVDGPIEDVYTAEYTAKRWKRFFKIKKTGKVYYTETGPDIEEDEAPWLLYYVEQGRIERRTPKRRKEQDTDNKEKNTTNKKADKAIIKKKKA